MKELRHLVAEAERLLEAAAPGAGDRESLLNDLRERFEAVQERIGEFSAAAKRKAVDGARRADDAIRDNPYPALALAAGVGLIAGLLLGRRSNPPSP